MLSEATIAERNLNRYYGPLVLEPEQITYVLQASLSLYLENGNNNHYPMHLLGCWRDVYGSHMGCIICKTECNAMHLLSQA